MVTRKWRWTKQSRWWQRRQKSRGARCCRINRPYDTWKLGLITWRISDKAHQLPGSVAVCQQGTNEEGTERNDNVHFLRVTSGVNTHSITYLESRLRRDIEAVRTCVSRPT